MAALLVWFDFVVIIVLEAIVSSLSKHQLYKHLWGVLISLLFSVVAMILWWEIRSLVISEANLEPDETIYILVAAIGLIIHAYIAIKTFFIPIK